MMDTTDTERSPTIRLTAAERRDAIVDTAIHEFALGAFGGTPGAATAPWGVYPSRTRSRCSARTGTSSSLL